MQLVTSRTISPKVNTNLLQSDFSDMFRRLEKKHHSVSLHPFINFQGQISGNEFLFPIQNFSLKQEKRLIFIENLPVDSFPKIEIVLEKKDSKYNARTFSLSLSNNSVRGQILYTRFFLMLTESERCSLNFKDIDFTTLNLDFSPLPPEEKLPMYYQAKLFRKLGFIESFWKTKFNVPESITPIEAQRIEVLFRGITEGNFFNPAGNSVTVFNYKIGDKDLLDKSIPKKREFSFELDEDFLVLDKFFSIGKWDFTLKKAAIANPRVLRHYNEGDIIPSLRLNVFDNQFYYDFKKYSNAARLLKNKQKLEKYKNALREEEPEFLVALLDEPLGELGKASAIEVVEGLLQYHDFPDRYSVLTPELKESQWKVPIALTYPDREPIFLTDAFVDVKTGKVEMKISFDELLKKGKNKAAEALSLA